MKQIFHARKQRQLRYLVKRLKTLSKDGRHAAQHQIEPVVRKIKALVRALSPALPSFHLKQILGPAALMLGISFGTPAAAQSFAAPQENPFGLISTYGYAFPAVADLDGDGDLDLMVGEPGESAGHIQYFQNTGTKFNPQFAAPIQNPFGIALDSAYIFPTFADLDNDSDLDLLVGDDFGKLQYYKNVGTVASPQFAAPVSSPFGLVPTDVLSAPCFVDLDGDGDMDLLVGEYDGVMQYFKNTGTPSNPQFAAPVQNPFGITSVYAVGFPTFADLDVDGDLDMLLGEYLGNLQYFKNTGSATNPQFAAPVQNPFGLEQAYYLAAPAFADLDGDGDMDLLVGEYGGTMQYYKNIPSVGTQEQYAHVLLQLHPNPVADVLTIHTDLPFERIEAYDALGKLFRSYEGARTTIQVNDWNSGTYLLKFMDAQGKFVARKVLKK